VWEFDDVFGLPNWDDDDENGDDDWYQSPFGAENDLSSFVITKDQLELLGPGHSVELRLAGETDEIRFWREGEPDPVLGSGGGAPVETYGFEPTGDDVAFQVEFREPYAVGTLTIAHLDDAAAEVESAEVRVMSSPVVLNHHLQYAEEVWIMAVSSWWGNNDAFVAGYQAALGSHLTVVPGSAYQGDVWMQDEFEFATALGSEDQRLDVVIDSIRDRGLDPFPENELVGPDVVARTWGNPNQATSYDSFGNLDATPPTTVDGVDYPFGRVYYGREGNEGLHIDMADFLASQDIQAPFELDTTWLCVGHVDEFSAFVPDPGSSKGFKLLMSDVPSAYDLLESLPQNTSLPQYQNDHGYATIGAIVDDNSLRALNEDLQQDYLTPLRERFKEEAGLEDADIILVPSLFEVVNQCGGRVAALIPGMVNLFVAHIEGDVPRLFVPDPFLRSNLGDQGSDPLIADFTARMPAGVEVHFLDNWDVYHMGLGEVHCGTNATRTPNDTWWTAALHLLGG